MSNVVKSSNEKRRDRTGQQVEVLTRNFERQLPKSIFFCKNGPTPASFLLIFGLFKQTLQFLQQIYVKKCPSCIQCRDSNPWPSLRESLPITTRQGFTLSLTSSIFLTPNIVHLTTLVHSFIFTQTTFLPLSHSSFCCLSSSVTRFGEISTFWQKCASLWQFFNSLFLIWQNDGPTLAIFEYYWASLHCC